MVNHGLIMIPQLLLITTRQTLPGNWLNFEEATRVTLMATLASDTMKGSAAAKLLLSRKLFANSKFANQRKKESELMKPYSEVFRMISTRD